MNRFTAADRNNQPALFLHTSWAFVQHILVRPALDLLFPPTCIGCSRVDTLLCDTCAAAFVPPSNTEIPEPLLDMRAVGLFENHLQKALHALKYDSLKGMAEPLAELMAKCVNLAKWPPSTIVPVPLHEDRLKLRGYNQAALLARHLAHAMQWPFAPHALIRRKSTVSQVGLSFVERQQNVKDAFAVEYPASIANQSIVLVDDVCTTGATLRESATALLSAGASSVRAIVAGQAASGHPERKDGAVKKYW